MDLQPPTLLVILQEIAMATFITLMMPPERLLEEVGHVTNVKIKVATPAPSLNLDDSKGAFILNPRSMV